MEKRLSLEIRDSLLLWVTTYNLQRASNPVLRSLRNESWVASTVKNYRRAEGLAKEEHSQGEGKLWFYMTSPFSALGLVACSINSYLSFLSRFYLASVFNNQWEMNRILGNRGSEACEGRIILNDFYIPYSFSLGPVLLLMQQWWTFPCCWQLPLKCLLCVFFCFFASPEPRDFNKHK